MGKFGEFFISELFFIWEIFLNFADSKSTGFHTSSGIRREDRSRCFRKS